MVVARAASCTPPLPLPPLLLSRPGLSRRVGRSRMRDSCSTSRHAWLTRGACTARRGQATEGLVALWELRRSCPAACTTSQCRWGVANRVSAFRSFQPELPVTARPSRSRQKQNVEPGKLHWFTSNVHTAPLTDHDGWNGEAFPCPVV